MATRNFTLKRKVNATTYDVLHPKTTWAQVEGKPSTFTPTGHSLDSHSGLLSISKLSTGANGQVIKMVNGVPTWSADSNTNTWRPVVDNLTSTSTTSSLSANQGKVLQDNKLPQYIYNNETSIKVTSIQGETGMPAITIDESSNSSVILGSQGISSVSIANEPIADSHAATKKYVDSKTMKLINSGSTTAISKTGYRTFTVPADNYAGKTVAVEIKYGNSSSTLYTSNVVYVTLGTSSSTAVSKSLPRYITISEWDGEYFKHISVKIYVSSGTTSSIYFGRVRTLIGRFTGSTIDWTTQENDNISVYIGKVWLVG